MLPAKKQTHRPTEQNRKPRENPTHLWAPYLWKKEARIYNGEKIVSSISDAGRTGQLHVKERN